jgi:hypothetical protein
MRATHSFVCGTEHGERWIHGGTIVDERDPLVAAFPGFFVHAYGEPDPEPKPKPAPVRRRRNG